jgi:hypothetical protein
MRLRGVGSVQRGSLENLLRNVGDRSTGQDLVLVGSSAGVEFVVCSLGGTHPACVGIKEAPEDSILHYVLHGAAAVQKDSQHALPQLYYARVLLCFRGSCSIVCHRVLLGNGRYNQRWVQIHQRRSQRGELRISALDLQTLY